MQYVFTAENTDDDELEYIKKGDEVEWTLIESGGATLDKNGVLTLPDNLSSNIVVISAKYDNRDIRAVMRTVIALPLPFSYFAKTLNSLAKPE